MLKKYFVILLITGGHFCEMESYKDEAALELSVIHVNDFHARFEPFDVSGALCDKKCIGGFSRLYETIKTKLANRRNTLLVNAGDNFFGTLWYDLFKWNVTARFLNKIPFDAYTLGNHEFHNGVENLVPFLQHLEAPVVCSNLDISEEPTLQGLFQKSIVIERSGLKIGLIGALTPETKNLNNVGKVKFFDELESINKEAERLVQEEDVFTNIVISHCGYLNEIELARKVSSKIGLIIGAHSHTFLYTGKDVPGPDIPSGPYPTIVKNENNRTVLVVQAAEYTKYLGDLTVSYDCNGNIINWRGKPIYLNESYPENEDINKELEPLKNYVHSKLNKTVIGSTLVYLEIDSCTVLGECLFGNFFTDAVINWFTKNVTSDEWTDVSIALAGSITFRAGFNIGNILAYQLSDAIPFANVIDKAKIKGSHLKEILEFSALDPMNYLQMSGIKVVYNSSLPEGSRIVSLEVRCQFCTVPKYSNLEMEKFYKIAVNSFLTSGAGGKFPLFPKYLKNITATAMDTDVLLEYLKKKSPIFAEKEGRIVVL